MMFYKKIYVSFLGGLLSLFSSHIFAAGISGLLQSKVGGEGSFLHADLHFRGSDYATVIFMMRNDNDTVSFKVEPDERFIRSKDDGSDVDLAQHMREWEQYQIIDHGEGWFSFVSHHRRFLKHEVGEHKLKQTEDFDESTHFRFVPLVGDEIFNLQDLNAFLGSDFFNEEDVVRVLYQDNRFPRRNPLKITHSWLYMPLIRSSLASVGLESENHLEGVPEEREFFERGISIFSDLVTILAHNLTGKEISFEGDHLTIEGEEEPFHFDDRAHMNGDHQERFLRAFFGLNESLLQSLETSAVSAGESEAPAQDEPVPFLLRILRRYFNDMPDVRMNLELLGSNSVLPFDMIVNAFLIPKICNRSILIVEEPEAAE